MKNSGEVMLKYFCHLLVILCMGIMTMAASAAGGYSTVQHIGFSANWKSSCLPKPLSVRGVSELTIQKTNDKNSNAHYQGYNSLDGSMDTYNSGNVVAVSTSSNNMQYSCSTDPLSCFYLARDSANILCASLDYIAKKIDRGFESSAKHMQRKVESITQDLLYEIDKERFLIYKNTCSYQDALRLDALYLEEFKQRLQVVSLTRTAENKYCYQAYTKVEAAIRSLLQEIYTQHVTSPEEHKQTALYLARKAAEFVKERKFKHKKAKQLAIAKYEGAVRQAEHEHNVCVLCHEAEAQLRREEERKKELFCSQIPMLYEYIDGQYLISNAINDYNPAYYERLKSRSDALAHTQQDQSHILTDVYAPSEKLKLYLQAWGYDDGIELAINTGNTYQQVLHQELLAILEATVIVPHYSPLRFQQKALLGCSTSAIMYNQAHCAYEATLIVDFCWSLLSYGKAIVEGFALGILNVAQEVVSQPFEVMLAVVAGEYLFAYQLGIMVYTVADIGVTACYDSVVAAHKWDDLTRPITDLYNNLTDKELTVQDTIKTTTAIAASLYARTKLLSGLRSFCGAILDNISTFQRLNIHLAPQEYLNTPDGMLFKSTINLKNNAQKLGKNNVDSALQKLSNTCQKIKITTPQAIEAASELGFKKTNFFIHGQPVFQKGNRFITIDVDQHNGGFWKMATSVKNLSSKKTRMGTYDCLLTRIGD